MKTINTILVLLFLLSLSQPARAQIDFSPLDPWRGWRPPAEHRQPVNTQHNNSNTSESSTPVFRPFTEKELKRDRQDKLKMEASVRHDMDKPESVTWSEVTIVAGGSSGFGNIPPSELGAFAALARATRRTPASAIPTTDLNRAFAILSAATKADAYGNTVSDEDAAVLAEQAAIAAQGGALQVVVDEQTRPLSATQKQLFRGLLEDTAKNLQTMTNEQQAKANVDQKRREIAKALEAGNITPAKAETQKRAVSDDLSKAQKKSAGAKEGIKSVPKTIIYILKTE